ncbi:helix-turn-helix domain-containing protein [Tropicibacter sp. R15_0]|uniref:helix-turn-helix domain-containing protein n=1 Tax=Tropicibacter sp. R15_0 TaxID=2821101 RepID=UPI001AD97369|nr:helix-turn-helix domain-containing protein [Tropicibacter sp. R15_0]MBO9466549.1 helix-turn-helix domain-containing protein [Tropicibacter sp. R15_0]
MDDETTSKPPELDPQTIREGAGLSVDEMAELIGMSVSGYRLWEDGHRQPGGPAFKLLGLIAQAPEETVRRLRSIQS